MRMNASTARSARPAASRSDASWKNGGCPDYEGKGRGCSTIAMVFPGDTQLYITVNSTNNASADLTTVASSAFDAALR